MKNEPCALIWYLIFWSAVFAVVLTTLHMSLPSTFPPYIDLAEYMWRVQIPGILTCCKPQESKTYSPTVTGCCGQGLTFHFTSLDFCASQTLGITSVYSDRDLPPPHELNPRISDTPVYQVVNPLLTTGNLSDKWENGILCALKHMLVLSPRSPTPQTILRIWL